MCNMSHNTFHSTVHNGKQSDWVEQIVHTTSNMLGGQNYTALLDDSDTARISQQLALPHILIFTRNNNE